MGMKHKCNQYKTMKRYFVMLAGLLLSVCPGWCQHIGGGAEEEAEFHTAARSETLLQTGWKFHYGQVEGASLAAFDDSAWEDVTVPHDWAIRGPFGRKWFAPTGGETKAETAAATWDHGKVGGLPYIGVGWYRTHFTVEKGRQAILLFDGAMSEARVYVNGREAAFWPCGYNSFHVDVTPLLNGEGRDNVLAVRLENRDNSSRWYPGAGLYRNVHLFTCKRFYIPVWGVQVTTSHVSEDYAVVRVRCEVDAPEGTTLDMSAFVTRDNDDELVGWKKCLHTVRQGNSFEQYFVVEHPRLWSPEHPELYMMQVNVNVDGQTVDCYRQPFGIRSIDYVPERGFYLNGQRRKFQGVCLHHDLGPLGAAVNRSAIRHQLTMLKEMGCDAIRTSHNMPAPELVELCDEMGLMMMVEPFDEWDVAKCDSGYHRFFKEWAEKDMVNMLRHYRNNPSVVMWSIGNEVPSQDAPDGYKTAAFLQDICHREDPTRPVTCGLHKVTASLSNGFAAVLDIPGFNYHTHRYDDGYKVLNRGFLLGSETASTVSSRGVYEFPVVMHDKPSYEDHQTSGYDVDYCSWSNLPDVDFALAEDRDWTLGQFVWTGFDYLGEPTPYGDKGWPSHSSLFGIIDLASLPKDRYYLYQSVWRPEKPMLHVLPHWTWPGREGEVTPVMAYTTYPEAELFVNGVSQGRMRKLTREEQAEAAKNDPNGLKRLGRYRLIWENVCYQPGEITVKAYDAQGRVAETTTIRTAGKPHHLELSADRSQLTADGQDLAYVTVNVVDKEGNLCPQANNLVKFTVKGAGSFRAAANGDPTNLDLFHLPAHHAFSGRLTAIIQAGSSEGDVEVLARSGGLKGMLHLKVVK